MNDRLKDFKPILRNEICIEDEPIYIQHKNLIKNGKYSDAATLLSNNHQVDACTASLLNSWEVKVQKLEICAEQKEFYEPYIYNSAEPNAPIIENVSDVILWSQEY